MTKEIARLANFGKRLFNASLTYSPNGVYVHFFDGKQAHYALLDSSLTLKPIDVHGIDIAHLSWDGPAQALRVLDRLNGKQFLLSHGKITELQPLEGHIDEYIAFANRIAVVERNEDSDLLLSDFHQSEKRIDSKFMDYQGVLNARGELAYLSNREGHPKLYISDKDTSELVFENPTRVSFIGPMVWSNDNRRLALCVAGELMIINSDGTQITKPGTGIDCARVYSWTARDSVLLKRLDGSVIEFDLARKTTVELEFSSPVYLGKDQQGQLLGVTRSGLFWGQNSIPVDPAPYDAFMVNEHLAVVTRNGASQYVTLFNKQLQSVLEQEVPDHCMHVNSGWQEADKRWVWLCTSAKVADTDVFLYQGDEHP